MTTQDIRLLVDPLNAPMTKQYFVYDVDGNVTDIYLAQGASPSGGECLHQQLEYVTTSGGANVKKISWKEGVWLGSAWEIQ